MNREEVLQQNSSAGLNLLNFLLDECAQFPADLKLCQFEYLFRELHSVLDVNKANALFKCLTLTVLCLWWWLRESFSSRGIKGVLCCGVLGWLVCR